ncbi:MAG: hypothetical protein ACI83B_003247 [Sediminicola sp.]|jgi:hypothetical protein|tara:strand:- start:4757 stop:4888 length:132 start_codon:yes stop_codon:yes gene_type:complete
MNNTGKDELQSFELAHKIDEDQSEFEDIFYIPIYSDIYVSKQN